jgi:uncharacterized protein with HEPN domain
MTHERSAFLAHALDCADFVIEQLAACDKQRFFEDRLLRDAVLRNLEVIGQCCKDYGIEILESTHPELRWRRVGDFRNQLAHEYLGLDNELIWNIVCQQLRPLRQAIAEQLESQG